MKIRLIYFDFPFWRAEASRIALHIGGIPFEDVRPGREEFRQMKMSGELPYGQLPVLDIDGFRLAQSVAIARFCGKVSGLYPKDDDVEAARVDELMDTATQITQAIAQSMREKDPEIRAALRETLGQTTFPDWLKKLERRLGDNDSGKFFVGTEMSIADLVIWRLIGWLNGGILDGIPTKLLDPCPKLKAHQSLVESHPGVQSWQSGRESN